MTSGPAAWRFRLAIQCRPRRWLVFKLHPTITPRELAFLEKAATIEKKKVQRMILDFELKQSVNRKLAKLQSLPASEQTEREREIAEENTLPIVNGKVALPDLRLEYEGPNQELDKVDLELVTGDYHAQGLAAKAQTGFAMYALPEDAARLRPAMSDPEIMLDILSL